MSTPTQDSETGGAPLRETPLGNLHRELGGRMVPFAGYAMPVQYPTGILTEHAQVRERAGLFDVSHMGQVTIAAGSFDAAARLLETVVPGDLAGLAPGRMRYSVLLNDRGGIIDDLIVTRPREEDGTLGVVVNADGRERDLDYLRERIGTDCDIALHEDRGLLALQGPSAASVIERHASGATGLNFMEAGTFVVDGVAAEISRAGYTGEDGFEISVAGSETERLARLLLAEDEVLPIGLGARDSLRLEAGLCLYGHDLDETTTPVEAGLNFVIGRRRREAGDFVGASTILVQLVNGPPRMRVGLRLEGRAPAREGAEVVADGATVGKVTSGSFAPTVGAAIAMAYVAPEHAATGTSVGLMVRGREIAATIADMPFVPNRYFRKTEGGNS